jgi:antitoxin MazE
MRVSKWGNSLAIRIPAEVVEKLELKADEEADVRITGADSFEVVRNLNRQHAIDRMRAMRFVLPENYKFDRDEIYDS